MSEVEITDQPGSSFPAGLFSLLESYRFHELRPDGMGSQRLR